MKRLVFSYLLLLWVTILHAQQYSFNQLIIANGLSSGNVTCTFQDSGGFIWLGTDNGLNKYDGYQFTVFRRNPQLPNSIGGNAVRCLFEDRSSNLWIGLKGDGLSCLNLKTGVFKNYRHTSSSRSISYNDASGIVEDSKGRIWVTADRGSLDLFHPETDDFDHYPIIDGDTGDPLNNAFTDLEIDKKDNLWMSTWGGGVYSFDVNSRKFRVYPAWREATANDDICKHIVQLYMDSGGVLWIASAHGGLYSLLPGTQEKGLTSYMQLKNGSALLEPSVSSLRHDHKGNLWIGTTNRGLYMIKADGITQQVIPVKNTERTLLDGAINNIYTDKTGIVWIATPVGVNYYSPFSYQFSLNKKELNLPSLPENQVLSVLKDRKDNVWVGGINTVSRIAKSGAVKVFEPKPNVLFHALHEDGNGNIWMGGYGSQLLKYSPQDENVTVINIPRPSGTDFSYRSIYTIYEDNDNSFWIGTELGVLNYNPAKNSFTTLFESGKIIYPEDKTHVIFRDQDEELWVGTENGLKRFDRHNKQMGSYTTSESATAITNNFITAIYEEGNGVFWVGTMGGLHRFDKKTGQFQFLKRSEKMYGDPVFGIRKDNHHNLWISTISEMLKFNTVTQTFDAVYNASDGLQSKDFRIGSYFQAPDGELFIGGKDGFSSFYPEKIIKNNTKSKVVITDLLIFNRSVAPQTGGIIEQDISLVKSIKVKHNQSVITLRFSALNYIAPEKNQYAYKLEGFDKDWTYVDARQRSATYTNLNSGQYIFKVKVANNDGVWNEVPTELTLNILPPLWRTWYAYLFYFLLLASLTYACIRYFTQRAIDRNNLRLARVEAERIKEMEEIKVNLFTNVSHEFRTPLSLILGPLTQIMDQERYPAADKDLYNLIYRNARRLLRLINQLLDFRKIEAGKLELNLRYGDINQFIRDVAGSFSYLAKEKNIQLELNITPESLWMNFDSDKLDKVLYNIISNAFHYTPQGGRVEVLVNKTEQEGKHFLEITVKDTGVGMSEEEKSQIFAPFYQGKHQKRVYAGGSGIGLALTKELIDLFDGIVKVDSKLTEGTTFCILLPLRVQQEPRLELTEAEIRIAEETSIEEEAGVSNQVLVVEDNLDMQLYIKSILSDNFKLEFAGNGEDGLDKALKFIPDLIISDIMMPVKDGMEMIRDLKRDDKTSHIPIILLTARHDESQVVAGYELGVDDYITKPFSAAILKARITNILASRKRNWEQYRQSENLEAYHEKLAEDPRKQEFINKINSIIMSSIDDPGFGVDQLAEKLSMSVNQLFRKVKTMLNTTPYTLIVQVRMSQAARLLRETNYNVSEITFMVGYQELSNFSRSFKKFYNISPKEYQVKSK